MNFCPAKVVCELHGEDLVYIFRFQGACDFRKAETTA